MHQHTQVKKPAISRLVRWTSPEAMADIPSQLISFSEMERKRERIIRNIPIFWGQEKHFKYTNSMHEDRSDV